MRKIVKFFRKSSVRNSILKHYVTEKEGKPLSLWIDSKTRWNSLIPMIERLIQLQECIQKALNEIGRNDLYHESDFINGINLIELLKPVELVVTELSKSTSNLLTAEGVITFLLDQLKQNSTDLGKKSMYL